MFLCRFKLKRTSRKQQNFTLLPRTGAFDEIKFALDATRQNGALNILTRFTRPGTQIIGGLTINRHHLIGSGRYGTKV